MSGGNYYINIKQDAPESIKKRYYPVPRCQEDMLKKEIERLCEIGTLRKLIGEEAQENYAFPYFCIPKKDKKGMQFVTDFYDLNKWVQRNPYLIPPIRDTLNKLDNFTYAIAIDISMGYWYIILDPTSQLKCIITKPWGRYAYQCLPMGLCISADIFQERIARLTEALEFVKVYINNLLCITKESFDDHLQKLE